MIKYECFFDGSITKNPGGDMGIGCLIYEVSEQKKEVIFEHRETFLAHDFPATTNNIAECLALHKILSFFILEGMTAQNIKIFGDSQIVINHAKKRGSGNGKGLFIPYIREMVKDLARFDNITFEWIGRDKNTEADLLSKTDKRC